MNMTFHAMSHVYKPDKENRILKQLSMPAPGSEVEEGVWGGIWGGWWWEDGRGRA